MSDINQISNNPNVDISKQEEGLCKIALRNTTHGSDKAAYRNCQIQLLSEMSDSATIGNLRHNLSICGNRKKLDRGIKKL